MYDVEKVKLTQEKLLGILDEFIKVCEEENLNYFLGGGSLIGALRHKGFIPWDDDIDIFMPRSDYEKLFRIWNDKADIERYGIMRTDSMHNYHFRSIGIVDKNTTVIKKYNVNEDIMHGLFMDVTPMDGVPSSKIAQIKQLWNVVLFNIYNVQRNPNFEKNAIALISSILLKIVPSKKKRYRIWKKAECKMSAYDLYKVDVCKEFTTKSQALFRPLPSKWFRETRYADFEGRKVKIPSGAEEYMTLIHGDFMKLPPEDERVPLHDRTIIFEDLLTPYKEYKGVKYLVRGGLDE